MEKITDIHLFVPGFVFKLHKKQVGGGTKSEIRRVTNPVKRHPPHEAYVANECWCDITRQWYMELNIPLFYYGVTDSEHKDAPTTFGWIESLNKQEQERFVPLYHGLPGITGDPVLIARESKEPLLKLRDLLERIKEVYPERESYMSDGEKKTLIRTVMEVASHVMSSPTHMPIVISILSLVATYEAIRELEMMQMDKTVSKSFKMKLVEAIANARKKNANMRQ